MDIANGLLSSLYQRALKKEKKQKTHVGFDLKFFKAYEETEHELSTNEISIEFVTAVEGYLLQLNQASTGLCFLIDEIDVLSKDVMLAPFIKSVVEKMRFDGYANISLILSGVTGSITELLAQHPSSTRLIEIFQMERMNYDELSDIMDAALLNTGYSIKVEAKDTIIKLSDKFPAPVHLLGYHAFRLNNDEIIDKQDVIDARDFVVQNLKQQEFQGRLDRIGGGLAGKIVRLLAENEAGYRVENLEKRLMENPNRIHGIAGNLIQDGILSKTKYRYKIAEPLFLIYLRWLHKIDQ